MSFPWSEGDRCFEWQSSAEPESLDAVCPEDPPPKGPGAASPRRERLPEREVQREGRSSPPLARRHDLALPEQRLGEVRRVQPDPRSAHSARPRHLQRAERAAPPAPRLLAVCRPAARPEPLLPPHLPAAGRVRRSCPDLAPVAAAAAARGAACRDVSTTRPCHVHDMSTTRPLGAALQRRVRLARPDDVCTLLDVGLVRDHVAPPRRRPALPRTAHEGGQLHTLTAERCEQACSSPSWRGGASPSEPAPASAPPVLLSKTGETHS